MSTKIKNVKGAGCPDFGGVVLCTYSSSVLFCSLGALLVCEYLVHNTLNASVGYFESWAELHFP